MSNNEGFHQYMEEQERLARTVRSAVEETRDTRQRLDEHHARARAYSTASVADIIRRSVIEEDPPIVPVVPTELTDRESSIRDHAATMEALLELNSMERRATSALALESSLINALQHPKRSAQYEKYAIEGVEAYIALAGHSNIPRTAPVLGHWLNYQRINWTRESPREISRHQRLLAIPGFYRSWDIAHWCQMFSMYSQRIKTAGHGWLSTHPKNQEDKNAYLWLRDHMGVKGEQYKAKDPWKYDMLSTLEPYGFRFSGLSAMKHYAHIAAFKWYFETYGHLAMPTSTKWPLCCPIEPTTSPLGRVLKYYRYFLKHGEFIYKRELVEDERQFLEEYGTAILTVTSPTTVITNSDRPDWVRFGGQYELLTELRSIDDSSRVNGFPAAPPGFEYSCDRRQFYVLPSKFVKDRDQARSLAGEAFHTTVILPPEIQGILRAILVDEILQLAEIARQDDKLRHLMYYLAKKDGRYYLRSDVLQPGTMKILQQLYPDAAPFLYSYVKKLAQHNVYLLAGQVYDQGSKRGTATHRDGGSNDKILIRLEGSFFWAFGLDTLHPCWVEDCHNKIVAIFATGSVWTGGLFSYSVLHGGNSSPRCMSLVLQFTGKSIDADTSGKILIPLLIETLEEFRSKYPSWTPNLSLGDFWFPSGKNSEYIESLGIRPFLGGGGALRKSRFVKAMCIGNQEEGEEANIEEDDEDVENSDDSSDED